MRRMILVTPKASGEILLKNYLDCEIVGMDEGISIALSAGVKLSLAVSSFKTVSLEEVLSFIPKEKIMKYKDDNYDDGLEKVISYLRSIGAEEIVILDSIGGKIEHIHNLFQLLKSGSGSIFVHDADNFLTYYGEGTHVISKQGYDAFSIVGFPEADISLEHVSKPVRNTHLSFSDTNALTNSILERVAVLKVITGGVLLALSNND